MGYSINVDWSNYHEKWENTGRSLIEQNCKHEDGVQYNGYCEKCEVYEDDCEPMMNYAYPLETTPDDDKIIEVCQKTCCTVMYNNDDDCYYIALCGGGMDLSQDIALAYHILEKWIPLDLALQVSTQDGLSKYNKEFRKVMRACRESIKINISQGKQRVKQINESIKKSLLKEKVAV
jgi:hypothetical protein